MNALLALPAPSAARTRERNQRTRDAQNAAAGISFTIHNAAQGANAWMVCALWHDFIDGGQTLTSCLHVANTEAEAKKRHRRLAEKKLPVRRYEMKMISAAPAGEVRK